MFSSRLRALFNNDYYYSLIVCGLSRADGHMFLGNDWIGLASVAVALILQVTVISRMLGVRHSVARRWLLVVVLALPLVLAFLAETSYCLHHGGVSGLSDDAAWYLPTPDLPRAVALCVVLQIGGVLLLRRRFMSRTDLPE
jgi:hypothetical protein